MEYNTIEQWFVTTVPGVIVLGAVGSILAVLILKGIGALTTKWLPGVRLWWRRTQNLRAIPHGLVLGALTRENNIAALLVYFAYRLMQFIGWLFMSGVSFVAFVDLFLLISQPSLTVGSYAFLVISMVGLWLALEQLRYVRVMYDGEIRHRLDQVRNQFESATADATTREDSGRGS